jgi:phosphoglycolate phosphatase-like HAD superfamily hydrolase
MAYRQLDKQRKIYVKEGSEDALRGVGKLILDFDGVLVQTAQSYRQTIRRVVDYYFLKLLGLKGDEGKLASLRDIQKFKDTGRFNNDWKLTYGLISYYLTLLMKELEQKNALQDFTKRFYNLKFTDIQTFNSSLIEVNKFLRLYDINATDLVNQKETGIIGLELFLAQSKLEKPKPIETSLMGIDPEVVVDEERLVKVLIPYDLDKPDLLKRLFEETYLGKELFTKSYGVPSFFNFEESFLDNEQFIPTKQTLDALGQRFGRFGVYSGRPEAQGMYMLEKYGYLPYFAPDGLVFLGDKLSTEEEMEKYGKPDPTLFVELLQRLDAKGVSVAYVGDCVGDAIMIENARKRGVEGLVFIGVVSSSEDSNTLFDQYANHSADAVVTDMNDIPFMLKSLGVDV